MFGLGGIFEKWMDGAVKAREEETIIQMYIPNYSKIYPSPIIMSYDDLMKAGCPSAKVNYESKFWRKEN